MSGETASAGGLHNAFEPGFNRTSSGFNHDDEEEEEHGDEEEDEGEAEEELEAEADGEAEAEAAAAGGSGGGSSSTGSSSSSSSNGAGSSRGPSTSQPPRKAPRRELNIGGSSVRQPKKPVSTADAVMAMAQAMKDEGDAQRQHEKDMISECKQQ